MISLTLPLLAVGSEISGHFVLQEAVDYVLAKFQARRPSDAMFVTYGFQGTLRSVQGAVTELRMVEGALCADVVVYDTPAGLMVQESVDRGVEVKLLASGALITSRPIVRPDGRLASGILEFDLRDLALVPKKE